MGPHDHWQAIFSDTESSHSTWGQSSPVIIESDHSEPHPKK